VWGADLIEDFSKIPTEIQASYYLRHYHHIGLKITVSAGASIENFKPPALTPD
jgi:hypothetical protein